MVQLMKLYSDVVDCTSDALGYLKHDANLAGGGLPEGVMTGCFCEFHPDTRLQSSQPSTLSPSSLHSVLSTLRLRASRFLSMRPNKVAADAPVNGGSLTSILTAYAALKAATLQSGKKGRRPMAAGQARIDSQRSDISTDEDQKEARTAYKEVEPTGVLEDGDRLLKELSVSLFPLAF